ncbi:IucA/IucC family protein [Actinomadura rupiterrae]|uniref:IucA/IucC family protein n=1 Tax=Actinomadura rupiterrae TaxID=559627 RepID=UPI0027E2250D|nr:IucA/IucC family protein [Actinomadura rupiterrae]MCP2336461.1 siderophore synthetase component [Actinomadura rupiterrae]
MTADTGAAGIVPTREVPSTTHWTSLDARGLGLEESPSLDRARRAPHPPRVSTEGVLAARVLDALLREDYGGLRSYARDGHLTPPGTAPVKLRADGSAGGLHPGFLTDAVVDVEQELRLADVLALAERVAHRQDDVAALVRECREALTATLLCESARPEVMRRLADSDPLGPGVFYETLAAHAEHPVYPCSRARSGLTPTDLRRHAPEFAPEFPLRWARVPRGEITAVGELPGWWPDPDLFPVHPLAVPDVRKQADVLPEAFRPARPTLSMRTLAADPLVHVKVPLPTSTLGLRNRRTIVPGTLPDGALAERLLRTVLDEEDRPVLLADEQTYGHAGTPLLAYLVRRFPAGTERAHVVPVAALTAPHPDGGLVIERWNVRNLFGQYLDALLGWNVALFERGIALEAHQQNVALVLAPGEPLRLLLKDNDGMLVNPDVLGAPCPFGDHRMRTRDREALARVFVTITLHLCAAAPAFALAEHGLLPRAEGLAMIRDRLDALLVPSAGPEAAFLRARVLDAPTFPTKAMVTAGTLVDKARTGAADINKHYGPDGPNYLRNLP